MILALPFTVDFSNVDEANDFSRYPVAQLAGNWRRHWPLDLSYK